MKINHKLLFREFKILNSMREIDRINYLFSRRFKI